MELQIENKEIMKELNFISFIEKQKKFMTSFHIDQYQCCESQRDEIETKRREKLRNKIFSSSIEADFQIKEKKVYPINKLD